MIHNELYSLKKADQEVLFSKQEWLNDRIMHAAQKLIRRKIGVQSTFQSLRNSQKKIILPFEPVTQGHVQLLQFHQACNH